MLMRLGVVRVSDLARVENLFMQLDKDNSGCLSAADIDSLCEQAGQSSSQQVLATNQAAQSPKGITFSRASLYRSGDIDDSPRCDAENPMASPMARSELGMPDDYDETV